LPTGVGPPATDPCEETLTKIGVVEIANALMRAFVVTPTTMPTVELEKAVSRPVVVVVTTRLTVD
jgi:hypothetical protein